MVISRKTDYGLIVIGALKGTFVSGDFISLKDISARYHLPYAYIEKLARRLKEAGVLASHVGKNGGYRLARKPEHITVQNIVDAFQKEPIMRCLHSAQPEKKCALTAVCPTRKGWHTIDLKIRDVLERLTIAQL